VASCVWGGSFVFFFSCPVWNSAVPVIQTGGCVCWSIGVLGP
jgi:hypothetical protein